MSLTLFYWATPNGKKVSIMLEECGLAYDVVPVDIMAGEQFTPEFLSISPNNKIPVLSDDEGPDGKPISVNDSVVILQYLAEKTGKFAPTDTRQKIELSQWLAFQGAHLGPMLGQNHHFRVYAPEKIAYAIDRYTNEAARMYKVLDTRLSGREWILGADYSIADMACYPWIASHERQGQDLADFPAVKRWFNRMSERPAVQKGMAVLADHKVDPEMDKDKWQKLFANKKP